MLADGGELNVNLQKMKKAETWPSALQGKNTTVDPITLEGMQKKIMLERFQSEVCISICMYRFMYASVSPNVGMCTVIIFTERTRGRVIVALG